MNLKIELTFDVRVDDMDSASKCITDIYTMVHDYYRNNPTLQPIHSNEPITFEVSVT